MKYTALLLALSATVAASAILDEGTMCLPFAHTALTHRLKFDSPQILASLPAVVGPYTVQKQLGKGGYAVVYLGETQSGQRAALKCQNKEDESIKSFDNEIEIMRNLNHENILKVYGVYDAGKMKCAALEYADGGDFKSVFDTNGVVGERRTRDMFRPVLDALRYLYEKKIAHHDIKLQNILIVNGIPKLADFGLSLNLTTVAHPPLSKLRCGTRIFMAPELTELNAKPMDARNADVYAFGETLLVMMTGREWVGKGAVKGVSEDGMDVVRSALKEEKSRVRVDLLWLMRWWNAELI